MDGVAVILLIIGALMLLMDLALIAIIIVGVALVWMVIETKWLSIRLIAGKTKGVVRKKKRM